MAAEKITATTRTEFGKGAARRLRRADMVPAVVYGHGAETRHLSLPGHATWIALKNGGSNALLDLDIEGESQLALTKQVQVDPIRRTLEHVDFVAVRRGERVTVDIDVHVVGEAGPDTLVVTENAQITVEAEATHIPEYVEVDVEGVAAGTQITAADLVLPSGSTLVTDPEWLVVNVTDAPTEAEVEADMAEAEAEAGIERDESDEDAGQDAGAEGDQSSAEADGDE